MNWGMMEILSPSAYSYLSSSPANWLITSGAENNHSTATTKWTQAENKAFENALALYDNLEAPDRWEKVAAAIPGKTVKDVIRQYKELELDVSNIEAGLADIEVDDGGGGSGVVDFYNGYGGGNSAGFTLEWVNGNGGGYGYKLQNGGRRGPSGSRGTTDHERKKGIPWTEEEHKLFLMGLKKYGKGDWRNISRNFVVTRTPTQVASHAQKYFIRQLSGGKDKRRASIHDITTSTLDNETLTTTTTTSSCSPPENHHHHHHQHNNSSTAFLHHHRQQPMMMMAAPTTTGTAFPWNQQQQQGNGGIVDFNSIMRGGGNGYVSLPYGGVNYSSNTNSNNPYAVKIEPGQQHNGGFNSLGAYNHQQIMQTPLHHFTH